jgi:hypothetical protein
MGWYDIVKIKGMIELYEFTAALKKIKWVQMLRGIESCSQSGQSEHTIFVYIDSDFSL